MFKRHSFLSTLFSGAAVVALGIGTASAQNYPSKPIRVVTTAAGTTGDTVSRLIGPVISVPLGQPVIIDNRSAGDIVATAAAQAAPDGHTVLYEGSALWLRPLLEKTPYDPIRDFQPITQSLRQPALLVVSTALPINSVKELIALAKARPGELNYATGSTGSLTHLAAELFQAIADVKLERIAYKNGQLGVTDLIAGRVQLMFGTTTLVSPQVKSGKLKALAVTSAQPSDLAPGLPTLAASGVPGFESVSNGGLFVPAKTPRAIVNRLNLEIVRALSSQNVKEKFFGIGAEPVGNTPEQFESAIKVEMEQISKLIKERGIRME